MIVVGTGFDKVTKGRENDCYPGVCGLHVPVISFAGVNRNECDLKCSGGDYEDIDLGRRGASISASRLEGRLNVLEDANTCSNAAITTGTMDLPHLYSALDQTSCRKVSFIFYLFQYKFTFYIIICPSHCT